MTDFNNNDFYNDLEFDATFDKILNTQKGFMRFFGFLYVLLILGNIAFWGFMAYLLVQVLQYFGVM